MQRPPFHKTLCGYKHLAGKVCVLTDKGMSLQVLYLFILDTVDTGFMAAVIYDYLVAHFGR